MIDRLITDYNSGIGYLSSKPNTIILTLSLQHNVKQTMCYINSNINVYNPFILGKHNPHYKKNRTKVGDKCCINLENTYDF